MTKKILPGTENITLIDDDKPVEISQKRRNEILRQLNEFGIASDNLSDGELLDKLASAYDRLYKDHAKATSPDLQNKLNAYSDDPNCIITDKEFIEKLFNMNVYKDCLKLFRNEDASLTKEQIWETIRFSGFMPIKEVNDIMRMRGPMNPKTNKRKMKDFD